MHKVLIIHKNICQFILLIMMAELRNEATEQASADCDCDPSSSQNMEEKGHSAKDYMKRDS